MWCFYLAISSWYLFNINNFIISMFKLLNNNLIQFIPVSTNVEI